MNNEDRNQLALCIENCPTMAEVLGRTERKAPDRVFLIEGGKQWTYRDFNVLVNRCCRFLESMGIKAGSTVSVILRNSVDYLVLYFAALRKRAVLNPFPFHLNADEVAGKVDSLKPEAIFCHRQHAAGLEKAGFRIINLDDIGGMRFQAFIADYDASDLSPLDVDSDQTAVMYYSSGTTGTPKLIQYTHRSMVLTQASMIRSGFIEPGSVHLCVLPLGHTASLRYTIKPCVCTASTVVLYESFWKLRTRLWEEIQIHRANFMEVVPTILIAMVNSAYEKFEPAMADSMSFVGCGSAFLPTSLQNAFTERFGIPVANLYGLSETGATHFDNPKDPKRKNGSIGKPFDIYDVKVFDDKGRTVPDGETGELGIRGPGLLKGYHRDQDRFLACFNGEYFMTGDLGYRDIDGYFFYVDRKKDLIIKGGVNIAPSQIDDVLLSHPDVQDAATSAKPDMFLGETVKSWVVAKPNRKIDAQDLMAFCRERIGQFKAPSDIEFVDDLPKGPSGKILKRVLREREIARGIALKGQSESGENGKKKI